MGSNEFILSEMHQIRKVDCAHRGLGAYRLKIPLMKMKCTQNSSDSDSVGELGRVIVDGREQHKYMGINNRP